MATRSAPTDRDFRTATTLPETWDEDTRSIEVVFSTGARAMKFDKRRGVPWIEDLPLRGMDVTELNDGAHVLRAHGLDPKTGEGLDAVIGSVVPGTARVVSDTEARARITLSRAAGKADVVKAAHTIAPGRVTSRLGAHLGHSSVPVSPGSAPPRARRTVPDSNGWMSLITAR